MNKIQLVGQTITCTNYATPRIFNFDPPHVKEAALNFLASGVTEIEIPQGVLDPDHRFPDTGLDEDTLKQSIAGLPADTKVVASYLGGAKLGADNAAYLAANKRAIEHLVAFFPDMKYAMLHPAGKEYGDQDSIRGVVETYGKLAEHARSLREGFQLCFHNHYDGGGETAEQVRAYLDAIAEVNSPALAWGPDTGHSHGMGEDYLDVFETYAHLIGDYFHIKARIPAFDQLHGGDEYAPERDIWSNQAEKGKGLYSGFVNPADPEIATPFTEIFRIIREKAKPVDGVVRGAVEIDNPRQHPRLEALCAVLYFKHVHGIEPALSLSNDEIVARVFEKD